MKTQGFTLVELLAVIVILAVLALIATPVVLSIIDDAKESAMLRSAEMYLSGVENAVMRENMNSGGNFRPNLCTISSDGNLDCEGKDGIIEVEVNGEKPKNGNIVFENGKIKEVTLTYQSGTIVKNDEGNLVYSDEQSDSGSEEEETLAAGLYDAEGNMTMSWQQLLDEELFFVEDGMLLTASLKFPPFDERRIEAQELSGRLVINDSVTQIEDGSFSGYSNLTSVIVPNGVTRFGRELFYGCSNLTSITIPNSLLLSGDRTFENCEKLTTINYLGTKSEWNAFKWDETWNIGCPEITVHCTDGDIIIPAWE